jgi:hypothetical protein
VPVSAVDAAQAERETATVATATIPRTRTSFTTESLSGRDG